MSTYLYRLARWCFRNRWKTLALWVAVVVAAIAIAGASGGKTNDAITIPGTEAQQALTLLQDKLPAASGASTQVVFAVKDGTVTSAANQAAIDQAVAALGKVSQVTSASNPFQARTVSPDKRVALGTVTYNAQAAEVKTSTVDQLDPAVSAARHA